jgi:hypothetical protein
MQQILQPDAPEHLGADSIGDAVNDFRAVLRGIDVDAERALADGRVDDAGDGGGDFVGVGIGRLQARQTLEALLGQAGVGAVVVLVGTGLVGRSRATGAAGYRRARCCWRPRPAGRGLGDAVAVGRRG